MLAPTLSVPFTEKRPRTTMSVAFKRSKTIWMVYFPPSSLHFIINNKQGLQVNPADQTVYYLQQAVGILVQISRQLPQSFPFLPYHRHLTLLSVHLHPMSASMFSGSWPLFLTFPRHSLRYSSNNGSRIICAFFKGTAIP